MYEACYALDDSTILAKDEGRRREKTVARRAGRSRRSLGGSADERKAVLAVSEGWLQYGPRPALAAHAHSIDEVPTVCRAARTRWPRHRGANSRVGGGSTVTSARPIALALANMDNTDRLMRIGERANRCQRHVLSGGSPGAGGVRLRHRARPPPTLQQDAANLRNRQTACGCSPT
jgi:hypothetical protein